MLVSLLMVMVYILYMIVKGAYFGISGSWKRQAALILFIGIINTISSVLQISKTGLSVED